MYDTRMPILDVRIWSRGDVPRLGLIDRDIDLLRGLDYDILAQDINRIDRILIPPKYIFLSVSLTTMKYEVKHA
jgi:hypothetical protein